MTPASEFLAQHAALTQGVGSADLSDRTRLEIRGADRTSFLHAFCTNDIKRLSPGHGCEAFITSPQGKTLGHVLVFCEPDRLLLDTSPAQAQPLIAHCTKYVITEDVEFVDRTGESGNLLVAGPQAPPLIERLAGAAPPSELLASARIRIADVEAVIRRVDYCGHGSFFVQVAVASLSALWSAIQQAGAIPCGPDAVEAARVEAGFPLFGRDITEDNLPQEIGRDAQAISFTKGCYLGQETVARIDALGHVNRLLVGLKYSGREVPASGSPIAANGNEVGHITSAVWSPALDAPLALGYIRRLHAKPGTAVLTSAGPAEVVSLPAGRH